MMIDPAPTRMNDARTPRFAQRRAQVLDAASRLINKHGVRGMTLTAVAQALDLDTSSVTYYFKRREHLAAACMEQPLAWSRDVAQRAAREPDVASRMRAFLHAHFELHRRQREPGASVLALTSDIGGLDAANRSRLEALAFETFVALRSFFADAGGGSGGSRSLIAATYVLASANWLPAWIGRYQVRDFDRVEARLLDILSHGIAPPETEWPIAPPPPPDLSDSTQGRFLNAAVRLINRDGYAGASVERIAAELGVSTGSFYHHHDTKEKLILTCFRRSFDAIEAAQARGDAAGANEGERLALATSDLVRLQFDENSPLLRMSAYQALPLEMRTEMLTLAGQVTRHIAGSLADGIADGSLRAVDPLIASQTITSVVSAAHELRRWAAPRACEEAVAAYLAPLRHGLLA